MVISISQTLGAQKVIQGFFLICEAFLAEKRPYFWLVMIIILGIIMVNESFQRML